LVLRSALEFKTLYFSGSALLEHRRVFDGFIPHTVLVCQIAFRIVMISMLSMWMCPKTHSGGDSVGVQNAEASSVSPDCTNCEELEL
jgi:hypothetical protein